MIRSSLKGQRLMAVFLLGCLALNYPLVSLFAGLVEVAGIPLLYAYVFFAWALIIALMAMVAGRRSE